MGKESDQLRVYPYMPAESAGQLYGWYLFNSGDRDKRSAGNESSGDEPGYQSKVEVKNLKIERLGIGQ
jgi:hypothetical protein